MAAILNDLPYELISLANLEGNFSQVEETGTAHDENALLKAHAFFQATGFITLAEDSGLEVDALKGELGLHTRRWGAGEKATDEAWLDYFLKRMEDVPEEKRTAAFVCSAALVVARVSMADEPREHLFHGVAHGIITHHSEAPLLPGLPLSSVFKPLGYDRVYAALSQEEKAHISHRGLAVGKAHAFLKIMAHVNL